MSGRQQLIGLMVVVLALLAGTGAVTGVAAGQTETVETVHAATLGTLSDQQTELGLNETNSVDSTQQLTTLRTTVETQVVTRNVTVNVTAIVENDRMQAITETLDLSVDGDVVATRYVTVPANTTTQVVFAQSFTDIGVHNISVGNSSAMLGVTKPEAALPPSNVSAADRPPVTQTDDADETTSLGTLLRLGGLGTGFVVLLSVVGVVGVRRLR